MHTVEANRGVDEEVDIMISRKMIGVQDGRLTWSAGFINDEDNNLQHAIARTQPSLYTAS